MQTVTHNDLVAFLIAAQRERGLSHTEMARLLGVAPSTWTRIRQGQARLGLRSTSGLIRAFPEAAPLVHLFLQSDLQIGKSRVNSGKAEV